MELLIIQDDWKEGLNREKEYDLIYLDPPFFTQKRHKMNKKGYEDGVVTHQDTHFDDIWESEEIYMEWLTDVFVTCFNKLSKIGTIYLHNNFNINGQLICRLPEEIRKRFSTNISWQRSHPHNNIKKTWGNIVDSIMVFTKTDKNYFKVQYQPLNKKYQAGSFGHKDDKGYFSLMPFTGEKSRMGYSFTYKGYTPKFGWRYKLEDVIEFDNKNEIYFGKNKPYRKQYLEESKGVPIQNIWNDIFPVTRSEKNKREYPTQKPVKLLNRIIISSCPPGGIMFDPFCGSGTAGIAGLINNVPRKVVMTDRNPEAILITKENINKVYEGDKFGLDEDEE